MFVFPRIPWLSRMLAETRKNLGIGLRVPSGQFNARPAAVGRPHLRFIHAEQGRMALRQRREDRVNGEGRIERETARAVREEKEEETGSRVIKGVKDRAGTAEKKETKKRRKRERCIGALIRKGEPSLMYEYVCIIQVRAYAHVENCVSMYVRTCVCMHEPVAYSVILCVGGFHVYTFLIYHPVPPSLFSLPRYLRYVRTYSRGYPATLSLSLSLFLSRPC